MVRHMVLFVVLLSGLSALGQTPPNPLFNSVPLKLDPVVTTTRQQTWTFATNFMPSSDYPNSPPTGDIRCWKDVIFYHFMCMNSNGTVVDIERDLELAEERWGDGHNVLSWSSASNPLPYDSVDCDNAGANPKLCAIEPDEPDWGSEGNGGGDIPNPPFLAQLFNQVAQRAADETDGKPPKCEPGIKNCVCAAPNKCRDFTQKEWEEFQAENAPEPVPEPVDVPAVRESLPSVCSFQWFQPMQCTNNGELDWSLAQTRGFIKEGEGVPGKNGHIYKCKDSSRILLTSEDGKKWCHKVQP